MVSYRHPDFASPRFREAPGARWGPAPADRVPAEGFFRTTALPACEKVDGARRLPRTPRTDEAAERAGEA